MTNVVISASAKNLKAELDKHTRSGAIEAEFGDVEVEGSEWSLNHHIDSTNIPPSIFASGDLKPVEVVGLSHFDLDTLIGCVAALQFFLVPEPFRRLVAHIDTHGLHMGPDHSAWSSQKQFVWAFCAWEETNKLYPPRDGSVDNCTTFVLEACEVLRKILIDGDEDLMHAGRVWADNQDELGRASYVGQLTNSGGTVALRMHKQFVNHLYRLPNGVDADAVVALNTDDDSIVLTFADNGESLKDRHILPPLSESGDSFPTGDKPACAFVQHLWGDEAGGHAGAAGSPRDRKMVEKDATQLFELVEVALRATHR